MKKIGYFILMVIFLMPLFMTSYTVDASSKTLRDLYNELLAIEDELRKINNDKNRTEGKINEIKNNVVQIDNEVVTIEKTILNINNDILRLNEEIIGKDDEIKELMSFFQLSTGENIYLEYAFSANSMTDFIYRLAIVEQLTNHNNRLINEMNEMIISQEQKSIELSKHQKDILEKKKQLLNEQVKLGDQVNLLYKNSQSLSDEIADAKKTIKNYERLGCKPSDILSECIKINRDVSFARPTLRGRITCGWLCYSGHRAVDIGGIAGENIYPTANGRVVDITWGSSCGGNYVTIQHNINGVPYASRYMHMQNIYVRFNDVVSRDTVIGTVGGWAGGVDKCTTGPHLHFAIARGTYAQDFWSFGNYAINPYSVIKLPPEGGWFSTRYGN